MISQDTVDAPAGGAILKPGHWRRTVDRYLSRIWWLLALCGVFDALHAAMNLVMLNPGGDLALRRYALPGAVWDMGLFALAAGACSIAAGLWNSGRAYSWLLSVHGLALGAFGLIAVSPLVKGPLSFRPVSLLFVLMAVSLGAFVLATAKAWLPGSLGVASIAFALSFFAVGFRFIRMGPQAFFFWMASYFALCAVLMLWLAFLAHSESGEAAPVSPVVLPRHA
jgi:hypothetical protein